MPGGCGALEECLAQPGAKVLMKSGRQLPGVLAALERRGLLERSALVSNCGLPGEQVYADLSAFPREQDAGLFCNDHRKGGLTHGAFCGRRARRAGPPHAAGRGCCCAQRTS